MSNTIENLNLKGADLRNGTFRNVDFVNTNLEGADLRGSTFIGCCLKGLNLKGAKFDECVIEEVGRGEDKSRGVFTPREEVNRSDQSLEANLYRYCRANHNVRLAHHHLLDYWKQ